jgi:hypothetical protein
MHWLLDEEFGDDLFRYRSSPGAKKHGCCPPLCLTLVRADLPDPH